MPVRFGPGNVEVWDNFGVGTLDVDKLDDGSVLVTVDNGTDAASVQFNQTVFAVFLKHCEQFKG